MRVVYAAVSEVSSSRRRDYHFDDTPSLFIPIETPDKGTGGGHQNDSLADG